jgi:hypothetical protein
MNFIDIFIYSIYYGWTAGSIRCITHPSGSFEKGPIVPFDIVFEIDQFGSEALTRLIRETISFVQGVRIEFISHRKSSSRREESPASTVGLTVGRPTIRITDKLDRAQQIEAIAHELIHLLLVYRFGLRIIGLKVPPPGNHEEVFKFCMNMNKDWDYILGQIVNTAHHLILIDYLKEECGIESNVHLHLLHHNFRILTNENTKDTESLYAKGIIAFEYERLIGNVDRVMYSSSQSESFCKAYHSATEYFESYRFPNIPAPSVHEESVLSFLEDLGYEREDFVLWPENFCGEQAEQENVKTD